MGKLNFTRDFLEKLIHELIISIDNFYKGDKIKIEDLDKFLPLENFSLIVKLFNYLVILEIESTRKLGIEVNLSENSKYEFAINEEKIDKVISYNDTLLKVIDDLIDFYTENFQKIKNLKDNFHRKNPIEETSKNLKYKNNIKILNILN